jgi:phosphatidylinositol 3-kinase
VALQLTPHHRNQLLANLFVEAQLMEAGVPIGLPSRTLYAAYGGGHGGATAGQGAANGSSQTSQCRWSDLLTFNHVLYWHLPRNAEMHLALRAVCAPRRFVTLGHCSFSLFSKKGRLKSGRKKVAVELYSKSASAGAGGNSEHASAQAHDSPAQEDTPSTRSPETPVVASGRANMDKLDKLMQRYDSNAMSRSAWLDVLAFRRIDQLNQALGSRSTRPVMMVEMERWERCVMYGVKCYSLVPPGNTLHIADAELCIDSPVELKHRKLTRSLHRAVVDRNLQPDSAERRLIHILLKAPWDWADLTGVKMNAEDKQLLWRYRFALTKEAKALTKCLISVDWSDEQEVEQAVELVQEWERSSTIDMNEALQLLSADFTHPKVRMAAARRVAKADDKELVGYLLQLVQALFQILFLKFSAIDIVLISSTMDTFCL